MKLKNKKTGEIVEFKLIQVNDKYLEDHEVNFLNGEQLTLKMLSDSFNDVKEPLIKDEKIRKAVRAWADACGLKHATYRQSTNEFYDADTRGKFAIKFTLKPIEVYLKDGEHYSIDELCGEEEK